jgi:hypothetical protein
MAVVRLGPKGGVGVITPPTAEEIVEAEAGLMRVARALGALMAEREWADAKRHLSQSKQDHGAQS